MERFLAGGTDGRIFLVARCAEKSVVAMCERFVDEIRFTLDTDETFLMPVFLLDTDVLYAHQHAYMGALEIQN